MRYFASSIMFALIIIVGVSCSSNDDQLENQAPSNFSIVIDTIGFDTASISWIKPQGENNESLDYTISLNNTIVAEQISEEGFTFTNLENAKMYDVEIVATNTQGVSTATTSFETLDIADFRLALDTYTIGNTVLTYYYDEVGNLVRRLNSNEFEKTHSYTYDSNGKLTEESVFYENSPDNSFADFDYENNVLVGYRYSNSLNDVFISTLKEPNNYIVAAYPDTNPDIFYSQIELERVDGLVTSFQHTVLNTQEVFSKYQFEYQNGNLTSIISELNEDVYTIEYDDKKTYGVEAGFITKDNHCLGFYLAMQNDIGYFPSIVDYTNSNNITRIYKNGEVIVSYEYEYNEFDLPVKIFVNGNSAPRMLTYTYVPKT